LKLTPKYLILATCLLIGLWIHPSTAQYQSLRFERITVEDGLPNPSVLDIIQDQQGFMWFGTASGIVRYDGYEMKIYYPSANLRDSLPVRNVPQLGQDRSGNIWVGYLHTDDAPNLYKLDRQQDRFVPYLFDPVKKKNLIEEDISNIREDRLGRLLVSTMGNGLFVIDLEKEKTGTAPKDLPFKHFMRETGQQSPLPEMWVGYDWAEDMHGNFWLPTGDGLCKFVPGEDSFRTFRFSSDTVEDANASWVTFLENDSTILVGSFLHGLLKFDLKAEKFVQQYRHDPDNPFSIAEGIVTRIAQTQDGKIWLSVNKSLDIFDPGTGHFTHIKDDSHESWDDIFSYFASGLITDYSGNIWMATWQSGVYKYNPGKGRFQFLPAGQGKFSGIKYLMPACEDQNSQIVFGTEGNGVVIWNRKNNTFKNFRHQPGNANSISHDIVYDIKPDNEGNLWIVTENGLDRMDGNGSIKHYHPFLKFINANVFISKKGELWVSSWYHSVNSKWGICKLTNQESGTFVCYPDEEGQLPGLGAITAISEDDEGKLWLGVNQWGFYIFDPKTGQFEHHAQIYGFHDIHFDRFGNTWLGTHSAGLKLWDHKLKKIAHLTKAEHDKIGIARGILEDDHGFLWMKTPKGIVKFDPQTRKVVQQFNVTNWMDQDKPWYGGRGFMTRSGEILYNSPSGVLYFHPDSLKQDMTPPKVAITELRLFNEVVVPGDDSPLEHPILQTDKIELNHSQNDITLVFAALHFKTPSENTYQYRLDKYDKDWRNSGKERTANYTNLSPGRYTFRLIAANSDGFWSDETTLEIVIRHPWWTTWWACLLYVLAGGSLFYFIRRYELKRQQDKADAERLAELDAVKSKLYTNITHEFRTPLTIILGVTEQLKAQASEGMKPGLDMVKRNGRQLLGLITQILDLSKLESGFLKLELKQADVAAYLRYLVESFHSFAKEKNIQTHFTCENEPLLMDFDPQRLQQIVSNLISNALKFTPPGGIVAVTVGKKGHSLQLTVKDSGIGISKEKLPKIFDRFYQADDSDTRRGEGTGIGLALSHELVKLMGGEISVTSELGKGTKFTVLLPVKNEAPLIIPQQLEMVGDAPAVSTPQGKRPRHPVTALPAHAPLVLVVEDNNDVVTYIHACLEKEFRIAIARNGQEGIDKALKLIPDLVVSDVMMPEKDGFEVCHFLKNDERTSHIPVILLTAKADETSKLTGLRGGADAYLAKPFNPEELLIRAHKLIELRKKLQGHYLRVSGLDPQDNDLPASKKELTADEKFVQKVRELIEANLDNAAYAVPDLFTELGMSRTQLHRKMTSLTSYPAARFIRLVRVDRAKKMLLETELNISEVGYQTGFSTPDYFSKVFRKETGMTPGDYRQQG
jgi:signal transduction histidine kinase/DNA-binding response OmpR family regulator/ligand-binding sensor domain-containing protein